MRLDSNLKPFLAVGVISGVAAGVLFLALTKSIIACAAVAFAMLAIALSGYVLMRCINWTVDGCMKLLFKEKTVNEKIKEIKQTNSKVKKFIEKLNNNIEKSGYAELTTHLGEMLKLKNTLQERYKKKEELVKQDENFGENLKEKYTLIEELIDVISDAGEKINILVQDLPKAYKYEQIKEFEDKITNIEKIHEDNCIELKIVIEYAIKEICAYNEMLQKLFPKEEMIIN